MIHRYPRRLIPKPKYAIIDGDFIREGMKGFFLLRKIKRDDSLPDFRARIKSQFLPSTFKKGISVLLLSVLRKEDIGWSCRKPCDKVKGYECKWEEHGKKAIFPKNKHLRYEKHVPFGGYKIEDVYEYEAEFPVKVKDKRGNEVERKDLIKLRVVHEPLCINFWHCEIFLYRLNGEKNEEEIKLSNKEMERAGNLILDDLAEMAYPEEKTKSRFLDRKYYKARVYS